MSQVQLFQYYLFNPSDGVVILEKIRKEKKFLQIKINNREV